MICKTRNRDDVWCTCRNGSKLVKHTYSMRMAKTTAADDNATWGITDMGYARGICTASSSHLRTMLPESSSQPDNTSQSRRHSLRRDVICWNRKTLALLQFLHVDAFLQFYGFFPCGSGLFIVDESSDDFSLLSGQLLTGLHVILLIVRRFHEINNTWFWAR